MRGPANSDRRSRRITVVSGYGRDLVTPRGQRTQRLLEALREDGEAALIAMPGKVSVARPDGSTPAHASIKQYLKAPLRRVLLDRWEPWSVRHLAGWRPHCDAALLIASPWSPVVYASRRLSAAGVPYVVDVGDPWVLTTDVGVVVPPRRARRAERFLWANASGAVVTTRAQADDLQAIFPNLPTLIRPNGYNPVADARPKADPAPRDPRTLRLAHFGMLNDTRLDLLPLLTDLAGSGKWERIEFSQFGHDFGVGLDRLDLPTLKIEHNPSMPWSSVVEKSGRFDAILAVAYPYTMLLPSKAIEYSTLPLPRLGLTNPDPHDALREYSASHAGWLAVSNGEPDLAAKVWEHLARKWSPEELAPSPEDAWPEVAREVVAFASQCFTWASRSG